MGADLLEDIKWFLARGDQQWGPFGIDDWERIIRDGRIGPQDWVWNSRMTGWMQADQVPGLLPSAVPPMPPPFNGPPAHQHPQYASPQLQQFVATRAASPALAVDAHGRAIAFEGEREVGATPTSTAMVAYVLHLIAIVPILPLIGLIISLVNRDARPEWIGSHFRYQVRTFLTAFVFALIGVATFMFLVGGLILLATVIWTIWRHVKGISALNRGEAIA